VFIKRRNESTGRISLPVKDDFDLASPAFRELLEEAYSAFPK